jgi:hypothetical protein
LEFRVEGVGLGCRVEGVRFRGKDTGPGSGF